MTAVALVFLYTSASLLSIVGVQTHPTTELFVMVSVWWVG